MQMAKRQKRGGADVQQQTGGRAGQEIAVIKVDVAEKLYAPAIMF